MKRRGQVTIFMIIGFVVLIGAGAIFFLREEKAEAEARIEIPGKAEYAGQEELRNFMEVCIQDASFQGIEIIRLQGGHIDISPDVPTTILQNDKHEQIILGLDGIKRVIINPESEGNEMAYWLDSNNLLYVPTIEYIENSLADYIENSVLNCVNDFSAFKNQNYEIKSGELNVDVELSDEVLVKVDYPLNFERGDTRFEEREFLFRLPVNLKKTIEVASDIVYGEYMQTFLEYDIKYLLSLYSYMREPPTDKKANSAGKLSNTKARINYINTLQNASDKFPPLSHADGNSNCQMITWQLYDVEEMLRDNFAANFNYISIKGYGNNAPPTNDDIAKGVYEGFTHDVVSEKYGNTEVDFIFQRNSDMFVDVKPRNGQTIRPHRHVATGMKFLPMFCTLKYQFKYTLKFPVLTRIINTDGRGIDIVGKTMDKNSDFEFEVPIGVFLCGNQNRQCTGKPLYALNDIDLDFSDLNITMPVETMFCDFDMRLSQPMEIRTIDAYDLEPLPGVPIFYKCGSIENECLIDMSNEEGLLETRMPLCVNGEMYVIVEGYSQSSKSLTTNIGEEVEQVNYLIEPLKELDVEVKLVDLPTFMGNYYMSQGFSSNRCTGEIVIPNEGNMAIIPNDDKNILITSIKGPSQVALVYPENEKMEIASGNYEFSYLVEGQATINPYIYQGQTVSFSTDGSTTYEGSYLFGSYDKIQTEFALENIKAAEKVIFYVPVEISSSTFTIADMGNIVQPDGSLYKMGLIDDDCNPITPDNEVEIIVSKAEVESLLEPSLE